MFSDANNSPNSPVVKGASVIFPENKVGKQLLNKSIGQLVEGKFLDPGVKDLLKFYARHGLSEESFLPQLVDVCGYKIIVEINNLDLAYEICRRYQSIDKMKDQLEFLWQEIEPQKLDASEQEYEQINNQLFDYLQDVDKRLLALRYISHGSDKSKEEKNKFFHQCLLKIKEQAFQSLSTKDEEGDGYVNISCTAARHLLREIIKKRPTRLNINYSEDDLGTIIGYAGEELAKHTKTTINSISRLRQEMRPLQRKQNTSFFGSCKRQQAIEARKKAIEQELSIIEPHLGKMILDSIMAAIEKISIIKA